MSFKVACLCVIRMQNIWEMTLHSVKKYQFSLLYSGSSAILPLTVWVYLHWNFILSSKRCIYSAIKCVSTIQGHPRSMILVPIESVSCWSVIVTSNFWYAAAFWLKIANFSYPTLMWRPSSDVLYGTSSLRSEVYHEETSHGAILQWRPHDRSLSRFDTTPACDRQTDVRTYGFTIAHTVSCWCAVKSITYVTTSVQVTRCL